MSESPFLNVFEVAERWRVGPRTVRDEINRKRLRAAKVCGEWRILLADVEAYEVSKMNVRPVAKRTRAPKRRTA